jgi:hypothetical protein
LQLSRKRGFNLQALSRATNGLPAINVARPSRHGNPWRVADEAKWQNGWVVLDPAWLPRPRRHYCSSKRVAQHYAVLRFRHFMGTVGAPSVGALRGCNVACFCGPRDPCHGTVLLDLANRPICEAM